ncbi:hypothetical protein C8R45DRAFT_994436 [Mycena sanguinolenta]|nr:hypothetical protein C8R45DRAFT_994436 [Mycena sanguinolenta]
MLWMLLTMRYGCRPSCVGTVVPAGTLVGVLILAEHHDEANYENADVFDPFRFSRTREQAGEGIKHQMVTPTNTFLSFGLRRHACPGRFFTTDSGRKTNGWL